MLIKALSVEDCGPSPMQRFQRANAVGGLHKPGQALRQKQPGLLSGFANFSDDVSNEKKI